MFVGPYTSAIAAIDAYAQQKFGAAFAALSESQQDSVLTDMEANTATGFSPSSSGSLHDDPYARHTGHVR